MTLDQCHSTVGTHAVKSARATPHERVGTTGQAYWRSLDDLVDTGPFREFLEREFPSGASRLLESSRRSFLKVMGASVALAGAASLPGCRRPDHKIYPYSKETPEDIIPGKALYFATSIPLPGGAAEGVLVETYEGRPVKLEGNPLHASTAGKSSPWMQTAILDLYDPDRLKDPVLTTLPGEEGEKPRSWADVAAWSKEHFAKPRPGGVVFLVEKRRSVSRDAMRAQVEKAIPSALWLEYDPIQSDEALAGAAAAWGRGVRDVLNLERADVVVSFERDFLYADADFVRNNRGWSARRQVWSTNSPMSRVYIAESRYTVTGSKADHRMVMNSSQIPALAVALARALLADARFSGAGALKAAVDAVRVPAGSGVDQRVVDAIAKDLLTDETGKPRAAGTTLLVAGPTQPAPVHALVHALNFALGNVNKTVRYQMMTEAESSSSLRALGVANDLLAAGKVDTIVCLGVNPVYDAPGSYGFAANFAKAPHRIVASVDMNETVAAATWRLPLAHWLESWGDTESYDGTRAPMQPMIAPLYAGKSDLEVLALLIGLEGAQADGLQIVRDAWRSTLVPKGGDFEKAWKQALHNGVFGARTVSPEVRTDLIYGRVAEALGGLTIAPAPTPESVEVVFAIGQPLDGRLANNAWLQEMPDPITKIVWDNVALIGPKLAEKYGLMQESETVEKRHARVITLTVGGQTVRMPAWVMPGVAENSVIVTLGYGRSVVGRVGDGVGFNGYPISGLGGGPRFLATGAAIARAADGERSYQIVSTQNHGSMEGRALVREVDLPAWRAFGDDPFGDLDPKQREKLLVDAYGRPRQLNLAERLGELAHTPANVNIYVNPQRGTKNPDEVAGEGPHRSAAGQNEQRLPDFARGEQWAMTIDLTTCTGCSACVVACQAENNIPVVGKPEVNKHREMHWIRIDRYFSSVKGNSEGEGFHGVDPDGVLHQPVACVHCENAPCETVCPVNATVHGPSGLNYMVYNRCIGTRYCANNCPYKVRRFNFFDYGVKKFKGSFIGEETLNDLGVEGPNNVNLIPPRLRERLDEISKMRTNPNVTVRSRGVMEKCSYCVQRINEARVEAKLSDLDFIPDGMFTSACAQACPTDAIVFGDMNDTKTNYPLPGGGVRTGSRVANIRSHQRSYALLGYLNTRPRTTHILGIRNPNPELVSAERAAVWKNPFHHGHDAHDGGHGGEHGTPAAPGEKPAEGGHGQRNGGVDPVRAALDAGYKLSLAVLNA